METISQRLQNWFVIQVKTGKEYMIKDFVKRFSDNKIQLLIFSRELIFTKQNKEFKVLNTLFPGYIFVQKQMKEVLQTIKKNCQNEFVRPLCFKNEAEKCPVCFSEHAPCMVPENEMDFLLKSADRSGIIKISYGHKLNSNNINFTNGPLKYLNNNIVWVNPKKKKICVEVALFNRKIKLNLGFDVIQNEEPVKAS